MSRGRLLELRFLVYQGSLEELMSTLTCKTIDREDEPTKALFKVLLEARPVTTPQITSSAHMSMTAAMTMLESWVRE